MNRNDMLRNMTFLWLVLTLVCLPGHIFAEPSSSSKAVEGYVTALGESLNREAVAQKRKAVGEFLLASFDFIGTGQAILKKRWYKITVEERKQFIDVFANRLTEDLLERVPGYRLDGITVEGIEEKQHVARVRLLVPFKSGGILEVYCQLRRFRGQWLIHDMSVDEKGLVKAYRDLAKFLRKQAYSALVAEVANQGYIVLEDFSYGHNGALANGWSEWREKDRDNVDKVYTVVEEDGNHYLHAQDNRTSPAIYRPLSWDLHKYPILTWRWRVWKLPEGADERYGEINDSAAGIYIVYSRNFLGIPTQIKYVWSTSLPIDTVADRKLIARPKVVVLQSGPEKLGQWVTQQVNLYEDFKRLWGKVPPKVVVGIGILTDANATQTEAEADYDDIVVWSANGNKRFIAVEAYADTAKKMDSYTGQPSRQETRQ